MALYVSTSAKLKLLMSPTQYEVVTVLGARQPITKRIAPIWVKFTSKKPGWLTDRLPTRGGEGRAMGTLRTEVAAQQLGIDEADLIKFLDEHSGNVDTPHTGGGKYFARIYETRDEYAAPDILAEDAYLEKSGDGFKCMVCQQQLDGRGIKNHLRSKKHRKNAADKAKETVEAQG